LCVINTQNLRNQWWAQQCACLHPVCGKCVWCHLDTEEQVSAVSDEPTWIAAPCQYCCKWCWMLSVINWLLSSVK